MLLKTYFTLFCRCDEAIYNNMGVIVSKKKPKMVRESVHKVSRRLPVADSNRQPATSCQLPIQF